MPDTVTVQYGTQRVHVTADAVKDYLAQHPGAAVVEDPPPDEPPPDEPAPEEPKPSGKGKS